MCIRMVTPAIFFAVIATFVPCHGELISLQLGSLKKINVKARNSILLLMLEETEKITTQQKSQALNCDIRVNETIASCKRCANDICQPGQSPVPDEDVFAGLLKVANKPLLMVVDFLRDLASQIGIDKTLTEKVLQKVRFVTRTVENALEAAGSKLFEMPISHVRRVGEQVVNELVNTVVETGKFVGNIGFKVVDYAVKTVISEVEKNGHKITDTAQKLGRLSKKLVGKKTMDKLQKARQGVEKAGREVGMFLAEWMGKLVTGLTDETAQDIVRGVADTIVDTTPDIVNGVADILGRVPPSLVNGLPKTIGKNTFGSVSGLTNTIQNSPGSVQVLSNAIGQSIIGSVNGLQKAIGQNINNSINDLTKDPLGSVNGVTESIGGIPVTLRRLANSVGNGISGDVNGLSKSVGEGHPGAVMSLTETFTQNVPSSVNDIRGTPKHGATDIVGREKTRGLTKHLILKRCLKRCLDCDELDTNKKSADEIVRSICGNTFSKDQQNAVDRLTKIGKIYNFISKGKPIITKVEFDSGSVLKVGGDVALKETFVTYQLSRKVKRRFRLKGLFTITNLDTATQQIMEQITKRIFKR